MMTVIKRARNLVLVLAVMLVVAPASAKEMSSTKPERQGFSSERLEKLTQLMNAKVEDGTMVGGMGVSRSHMQGGDGNSMGSTEDQGVCAVSNLSTTGTPVCFITSK